MRSGNEIFNDRNRIPLASSVESFFFFLSTGLCDDSNIDVSNSAEKTYPINDMSISMTSASLSVPSRILTSVENERSDLLRDTKGETERDD